MSIEKPSVTLEENKEAEKREENYKKMLTVLDMFGTKETKDHFLDTAENYYRSYRAQNRSKLTGAIEEAEDQRANSHNKIMKTLQHLSLNPKITKEQEQVLFSLANRDKVNEMLNDYFDIEIYFRHPKITKMGKMREGYFE